MLSALAFKKINTNRSESVDNRESVLHGICTLAQAGGELSRWMKEVYYSWSLIPFLIQIANIIAVYN